MNILWFGCRFSESLTINGVDCVVGSSGVEPPTSCLSGMRSNLLSYEPVLFAHFRNSPLIFGFIPLELHISVFQPMVEMKGFEPLTPCLQGRCSPNWATPPFYWVCVSGLNWILTIEQQNLSVQHVIHIYQVFCPNLTTSAQERLAFLASLSP